MSRQKGFKLSEEHKIKLSKAHAGKKLTAEHKRKISESMIGKNVGKKRLPHIKQKLRICNTGKQLSDDMKQKISKGMTGKNLGDKNHKWKCGRKKCNGYYLLLDKEHPRADYQGYVFEHRLVMEKYLNRYLLLEEKVHHINGIKDDNRIENLMLFASSAEHLHYHKQKRQEGRL